MTSSLKSIGGIDPRTLKPEPFQGLALIRAKITIWSGSRHAQKEDLKIAGGRAPKDTKILTLGGKKIYPPGALNAFHALEKRKDRYLASKGFNWEHVAAVSGELLPEVWETLLGMMTEWDVLLDNFRGEYDERLAAFIEGLSDDPKKNERKIVEAAKLSLEDALRSFSFTLKPWVSVESKEVAVGSVEEAQAVDFVTALLEDVAKTASGIFKRSFVGHTDVNPRIFEPIEGIHRKLVSLAFLHPGVRTLADTLARVLQGGRRWLEGADMLAVAGVLAMLSDVEDMKVFIDGIAEGRDMEEAIREAADIITQPPEEDGEGEAEQTDEADTQTVEVESIEVQTVVSDEDSTADVFETTMTEDDDTTVVVEDVFEVI